MSELINGKEGEALKMQYKTETNQKLENLLKQSIGIEEIAKLLNAEEFLSVDSDGLKEPVISFDAKAFIDREIRSGTFLKLPDAIQKIDSTILPPDESEVVVTGNGSGFEKKEIIPRSFYLIEVLTNLKQKYSIIEGVNTGNMMREQSYKIFLLPDLQKLVLVNDEEGNATFIIHDVEDTASEWVDYSSLTKEEIKK